jgi:drug/metabolite transporter (DMT)-like permease
MITAAFCFATMGALAHVIGPRCDWLAIALVRILCTFVFSVAIATLSGVRLVLWRPRTLWVRSLSGTVSLVCSFYALTRLPVADVLTLTNTYPLWIVLISLRERHGSLLADLFCVACGIVGVALIQRPYLAGKGDVAILVALLGSVTTAVAMLGLHRLREVDASAVVAHFSGLASLLLCGWAGFRPQTASLWGLGLASGLVLLGVGLSGTMGQVLLTKAFASGPPTRISILSLTQVVFAMGYDVLLQGRVMTAITLAGFALVIFPTAWITLRGTRFEPDPSLPRSTPGS